MGPIEDQEIFSASDDDDCVSVGDPLNDRIDDDRDLKVKVWPLGDSEPTGYSIKGKSTNFKNAVAKLDEILVRGKTKDIDELKIFIADRRNIPYGVEIEVEISEKNSKGYALIKMFSKNKSKEKQ